jgi:hypothetical protein
VTDENNMLNWSTEYRNLLTNPVLTPILEELLSPSFRLDHIYGQTSAAFVYLPASLPACLPACLPVCRLLTPRGSVPD